MKFDVLKIFNFKVKSNGEKTLSDEIDLQVSVLRSVIYTVILLFILFYQSSQPEFINLSLLTPLYGTIIFLFLLQVMVSLWPLVIIKSKKIAFMFFVIDTIALTWLLFVTGINFALFIFLYLINIILCGISFNRNYVFFLASLTSVMYTVLLISQEGSGGLSFYFSVLMNNLSFFLTAFISSYLSGYVSVLGKTIEGKNIELSRVQDFNVTIVDNISSGLMVVSEEGVINYCNDMGLEILGGEVEDKSPDGLNKLVGQSLAGQTIESFLPEIFKDLQKGLGKKKGTRRIESEVENIRGDQIVLEVLINAVEDHSEKKLFVLLFNDLTKVKRLEFAMRQSEKLAAVGQLAAGIAHEIRNPLASISGSVQLIQDMPDDSDRDRLFKIISREIDRLNNLITEFMDFVRPNKIPTEKVGVGSLVNDCIELLKLDKSFNKNIKINVQIDESNKEEKIMGDEGKLKQAFLNILINGCHAVEKVENPKVGVILEKVNNSLVVKFQDNGCGMKEVDRKKMFEPFHTTKAKGTGLGLAITHKVFEYHNAQVYVKSEQGIGTEFLIEFPLITKENK